MVQASVSGAETFDEFAENTRDFKDSVDDILKEAIYNTAEVLREYVVRELRRDGTSQGGTYDSRTSPYSPGGENESSDDSLHITEESAWNIARTGRTEVTFFPRQEVRQRARYIAFGTTDHGPSGEEPMYFNLNGVTVVLSDVPPIGEDGESVDLGERFEGEPIDVSGVEPTMFFAKAIAKVQAQGILQRELNKAFVKHLEASGLGELQ